MWPIRSLRAGISSLIVCATLLSNVVGVYASEGNFWQERNKAARHRTCSPLLAQLPGTSHPIAAGVEVIPALAHAPSEVPPSLRSLPAGVAKQLGWLPGLVAPFGEIREIHLSSLPNAPLIIHLQDAHEVEEAQRNLAGLVEALHTQKEISLVGLEGAVGGFDLDPYRSSPNPDITRGLADAFLKLGYLTGPEVAGIVASKPPTLWGVEDLTLYQEHIEAFQSSERLRNQVQSQVAKLSVAADAAREKIYSPALRSMDDHRLAYAAHREPLGDYVLALTTAFKGNRTAFPNVTLLQDALLREKGLDFKEVEQERLNLVEVLVQRLSPGAINQLAQESFSYRAGRLAYGDYHRFLMSLCRDNGIHLDTFAQLNAYIAYLLLAERIDSAALLQEINDLEGAVLASLAQTEDQRRLVVARHGLSLLEKLTLHGFTPDEWKAYQAEKKEILQIPETLSRLSDHPSSAGVSLTAEILAPFEMFCARALDRNGAMVKNLMEKMRADKSSSAVFVTGGFHTDGITHILRQEGYSYAVVTPRISKVPETTRPLDIFARAPLPLEKLLAGDVIHLAYAHLLQAEKAGVVVAPAGLLRQDTLQLGWLTILNALSAIISKEPISPVANIFKGVTHVSKTPLKLEGPLQGYRFKNGPHGKVFDVVLTQKTLEAEALFAENGFTSEPEAQVDVQVGGATYQVRIYEGAESVGSQWVATKSGEYFHALLRFFFLSSEPLGRILNSVAGDDIDKIKARPFFHLFGVTGVESLFRVTFILLGIALAMAFGADPFIAIVLAGSLGGGTFLFAFSHKIVNWLIRRSSPDENVPVIQWTPKIAGSFVTASVFLLVALLFGLPLDPLLSTSHQMSALIQSSALWGGALAAWVVQSGWDAAIVYHNLPPAKYILNVLYSQKQTPLSPLDPDHPDALVAEIDLALAPHSRLATDIVGWQTLFPDPERPSFPDDEVLNQFDIEVIGSDKNPLRFLSTTPSEAISIAVKGPTIHTTERPTLYIARGVWGEPGSGERQEALDALRWQAQTYTVFNKIINARSQIEKRGWTMARKSPEKFKKFREKTLKVNRLAPSLPQQFHHRRAVPTKPVVEGDIVHLAMEMDPFAKYGGLADVSNALPRVLNDAGQKSVVIMPFHKSIHEKMRDGKLIFGENTYPIEKVGNFHPRADMRDMVYDLYSIDYSGFQVYFVDMVGWENKPDQDGYFEGSDGHAQAIRFSFCAVNAIEQLKNTSRLNPGVIHAHDWHLAPSLAFAANRESLENVGRVFSLHNGGESYQGRIYGERAHSTFQWLRKLGLPQSLYNFDSNGLEFNDSLNLLKAGFIMADAVVPVSPQYGREIMAGSEFGTGLEGFYRYHQHKIFGTLNGAPLASGPMTLPLFKQDLEKGIGIAAHNEFSTFDEQDLSKKQSNKVAVRNALGLESKEESSNLHFMVGRFTDQKGLKDVVDATEAVVKDGDQVYLQAVPDRPEDKAVIIELMKAVRAGTPYSIPIDYKRPPEIQRLLDLANENRDNIRLNGYFDSVSVPYVMAAADFVWMPSKWEPCGLVQMLAFKFGAIPVVTDVGGLHDTVVDPLEDPLNANGFKVRRGESYVDTLSRARQFKKQESKKFAALQVQGMTHENRWENMVPDFLQIYSFAQSEHRSVKKREPRSSRPLKNPAIFHGPEISDRQAQSIPIEKSNEVNQLLRRVHSWIREKQHSPPLEGFTDELKQRLANLERVVGRLLNDEDNFGVFDADILFSKIKSRDLGFLTTGNEEGRGRLGLSSLLFNPQTVLYPHQFEFLLQELWRATSPDGENADLTGLRFRAEFLWKMSPSEARSLSLEALESHPDNGMGRAIRQWRLSDPESLVPMIRAQLSDPEKLLEFLIDSNSVLNTETLVSPSQLEKQARALVDDMRAIDGNPPDETPDMDAWRLRKARAMVAEWNAAPFDMAPVESHHPFLQAITELSREEETALIQRVRALVETNPKLRRVPLINAVLLFAGNVPADYAKLQELPFQCLYNISAENRVVWGGGLGPVDAFHSDGKKVLLGGNIENVDIEPDYTHRLAPGGGIEEIAGRFAQEINNIEEVPGFSLPFHGETLTVTVRRGTGAKGNPVYLLGHPKYTKMLYAYGTRENPVSGEEFTSFMSAASLVLVAILEKERAERLGDKWRQPILHSNDGQTSQVSVLLSEVGKAHGENPFVSELVESFPFLRVLKKGSVCYFTTHTYKNRMYYGWFEAAKHWIGFISGIVNEFVQAKLFRREGIYDPRVLSFKNGNWKRDWDQTGTFGDLTTAAILTSHGANGVAAEHASDVRRNLNPGSRVVGVTNGASMDYVAAYFRGLLSQANPAESVDLTRPSPQQTGQAKTLGKRNFFNGLLSNSEWRDERMARYFQAIFPTEKSGDRVAVTDDFVNRGVVGHAGRLVSEKFNRDRAWTDENITAVLKRGDNVVILGGLQKGNKDSEDMRLGLLTLQMTLNQEAMDSSQPMGRIIFLDTYTSELKKYALAAMDILVLDSDEDTEANGYTEVAASAMGALILSPGYVGGEGLIRGQGMPFDPKVFGRGNTLIAKDKSSQAYLNALNEALDLRRSNPIQFSAHQSTSIRLSRVLETNLTCAAYLREYKRAYETPLSLAPAMGQDWTQDPKKVVEGKHIDYVAHVEVRLGTPTEKIEARIVYSRVSTFGGPWIRQNVFPLRHLQGGVTKPKDGIVQIAFHKNLNFPPGKYEFYVETRASKDGPWVKFSEFGINNKVEILRQSGAVSGKAAALGKTEGARGATRVRVGIIKFFAGAVMILSLGLAVPPAAEGQEGLGSSGEISFSVNPDEKAAAARLKEELKAQLLALENGQDPTDAIKNIVAALQDAGSSNIPDLTQELWRDVQGSKSADPWLKSLAEMMALRERIKEKAFAQEEGPAILNQLEKLQAAVFNDPKRFSGPGKITSDVAVLSTIIDIYGGVHNETLPLEARVKEMIQLYNLLLELSKSEADPSGLALLEGNINHHFLSVEDAQSLISNPEIPQWLRSIAAEVIKRSSSTENGTEEEQPEGIVPQFLRNRGLQAEKDLWPLVINWSREVLFGTVGTLESRVFNLSPLEAYVLLDVMSRPDPHFSMDSAIAAQVRAELLVNILSGMADEIKRGPTPEDTSIYGPILNLILHDAEGIGRQAFFAEVIRSGQQAALFRLFPDSLKGLLSARMKESGSAISSSPTGLLPLLGRPVFVFLTEKLGLNPRLAAGMAGFVEQGTLLGVFYLLALLAENYSPVSLFISLSGLTLVGLNLFPLAHGKEVGYFEASEDENAPVLQWRNADGIDFLKLYEAGLLFFLSFYLTYTLLHIATLLVGAPVLVIPNLEVLAAGFVSSLLHARYNYSRPTGSPVAMGGKGSRDVGDGSSNGTPIEGNQDFASASLTELVSLFNSPLVDEARPIPISQNCVIKRVSLPTKSNPNSHPQSPFDVLRFILWNPAAALRFGDSISLDFVYETRGEGRLRLVAIYPSPSDHPQFQLRYYLDLAQYGFTPPADWGNQDEWRKATEVFRRNYEPSKELMSTYEQWRENLIQEEGSSGISKLPTFDSSALETRNLGWMDCQNNPYFVAFYSENPPVLNVLPYDPKIDEGDVLGANIPVWRKKYPESKLVVRPVYPTVYDSFINLRQDRDFLIKINQVTQSTDRVLLIGPGPALDEWLASLKGPKKITVFGINPFEVASSRQLRRIQGRDGTTFQGDAVSVLGDPTLLSSASYDLIIWGMPWWEDQNRSITPLIPGDMRDYHDGSINGIDSLDALLVNMTRILAPGGRVLLWNQGSYQVQNKIKEAITKFNAHSNQKLMVTFSPIGSQWGVYYIHPGQLFSEPEVSRVSNGPSAGGRWPLLQPLYGLFGKTRFGQVLLPVVVEWGAPVGGIFWAMAQHGVVLTPEFLVGGVLVYLLVWHMLHVVGAEGTWKEKIAFAFSREKRLISYGTILLALLAAVYFDFGVSPGVLGAQIVGILSVPHLEVNRQTLRASLLGGPAGEKINSFSFAINLDDLRKRVASERESLARNREALAVSLGLEANTPAVDVAPALAHRHGERSITEKTIIGELNLLLAASYAGGNPGNEADSVELVNRTVQAYHAAQGLFSDEQALASSIGDGREIALEVTVPMVKGDSKSFSPSERAQWNRLVMLAREASENRLKKPVRVVFQEGIAQEELEKALQRQGCGSLLGENHLPIPKAELAISGGKYSINKFLARIIKSRETPEDLGAVDMYLMDRSQWDWDSLLANIQKNIRLLVVLPGLVIDATHRLPADLKRIIAINVTA